MELIEEFSITKNFNKSNSHLWCCCKTSNMRISTSRHIMIDSPCPI